LLCRLIGSWVAPRPPVAALLRSRGQLVPIELGAKSVVSEPLNASFICLEVSGSRYYSGPLQSDSAEEDLGNGVTAPRLVEMFI
jgi:hypothetical protein